MIKSLEVDKPKAAQTPQALRVLAGLLVVLILSLASWWITRQVYAQKELLFHIPSKVLEYPLWAALVGLLGNILLRLTGARDFIRPGVRTELFLKIGLILMGATINLSLILNAAGGAVLQAAIMMPSVFFFSWWLAGKFGLDEKLRAVMSAALSVCGVSAAIAAAGSVSARKEQVTYVTGLVILVALPMMILTPVIGSALGLSETVAGAWFGGNIDTTAAVVGAGTIYGEKAQEIASIVKNTQNTLIGVMAFILALVFASRDPQKTNRPSPRVLWDRFPKFVLGFVIASILFSLGWIDGGKGSAIDALKNWAFTLAFVSMGIDLSLSEFRRMGWKPVAVFLMVTVFNTLLALLVSWLIFTYIFPIAG